MDFPLRPFPTIRGHRPALWVRSTRIRRTQRGQNVPAQRERFTESRGRGKTAPHGGLRVILGWLVGHVMDKVVRGATSVITSYVVLPAMERENSISGIASTADFQDF